jgi:hypothetical protein
MSSRYSLELLQFLLEHIGRLSPLDTKKILTEFRVQVFKFYSEEAPGEFNPEMNIMLEQAGARILEIVERGYPDAKISHLKKVKFDEISISSLE